jgi:hypothetical protein
MSVVDTRITGSRSTVVKRGHNISEGGKDDNG